MLVVSDTSPLTALLNIGRADLLRQLFTEVIIPRLSRRNSSAATPFCPAGSKSVHPITSPLSSPPLGSTWARRKSVPYSPQ